MNQLGLPISLDSKMLLDNFVGNTLIAWNKASENKMEDSFLYLKNIPKPYYHLKKIQGTFLRCYFDSHETLKFYEISKCRGYPDIKWNQMIFISPYT